MSGVVFVRHARARRPKSGADGTWFRRLCRSCVDRELEGPNSTTPIPAAVFEFVTSGLPRARSSAA